MKKTLIIITILTMSLIGLMKVDALEGYARYETIHDSSGTRWPVAGEGPAFYYQQLGNTNANQLVSIIGYFTPNGAGGNNLTGGYDYVELSFLIFGNKSYNVSQSSTITDQDINACRTWTCESYNNSGTCSQYRCLNWYNVSGGDTNTIYDIEQRDVSISMAVSLIRQDGIATQCEVDMEKQKITCPLWAVERTGWNRIRIQYNMNNAGSNLPVYIGISRTLFMYNDSTSVIQQQTEQQQQQFNDFMNETQTYDDQMNPNISGTQEMGNYTEMEDNLFEDMELNTTILDEISINPNASNFIWNIVEGLRSISPAIITLFTSILGLGIIKLVLNR